MLKMTLCLLAIGSMLASQTVPERPGTLVYKPLTFLVPQVKEFSFRLKNGIPVYMAADSQGVPFVRLNVMFKGGKYLDPVGKEGLSSLAGSLWRTGGTVETTAEKLDERLEFLAGEISCNLGATSGSMSMQVMEKDLKEGMDLFMQVMLTPAFEQSRIDLAKNNALQMIRARNDSVTSIADYQLNYLLNGEGHFSTAETTVASLASITRDDLKAFQEHLVHPANLVIAISGKFDRKAMLDLLNRSFGRLVPAKSAQVSPKAPAPKYVRKPGIYVVEKDVPQSMVQVAIPGLRRTDPDWHSAMVMNDILGGSGFSSRLMKKLRSDEGLTYGVGTGFSQGAHWKGDFSCSLQTKNRSVAYALRLILEEIETIKREPVTEVELKIIKDGIIASFPAQWANKPAVANMFASEHLNGWPADWWVDYREKIQAVTTEDVQRVAKKYLDLSQAVILVVGRALEAEGGDVKDHPGLLKDVIGLPLKRLPLRDPLTLKPLE